jgi:nucleoside 2-deoxyribosyltransferase
MNNNNNDNTHRPLSVYVAGPISGLDADTVFNYFQGTADTLKGYGYNVFSPLAAKAHLRTEVKFKSEGYGDAVTTNHSIFNRDKWMVMQSDIVLCNLSKATHVSIGSMMELAWSSNKGNHTIVVMDKTNIHYHAFVLEAASIVFETLDEALEYLHNLQNN